MGGPAPPWLGLLSFSPQQSECDREHRYPHRNPWTTIMHNFRVNERSTYSKARTSYSAKHNLKRTSYYTRKRRQQRAPNNSLLFA